LERLFDDKNLADATLARTDRSAARAMVLQDRPASDGARALGAFAEELEQVRRRHDSDELFLFEDRKAADRFLLRIAR
jgi:hypothetical protein